MKLTSVKGLKSIDTLTQDQRLQERMIHNSSRLNRQNANKIKEIQQKQDSAKRNKEH